MSLNNVHMWQKDKYVPITIEEACKYFVDKVSYKSETFICKLCGNYVTLTSPKSGKVERHFRHRPLSYDKTIDPDQLCIDRSKHYEKIYEDIPPLAFHVMPMKLCINNTSFNLRIGFYCPDNFKDLDSGFIHIFSNTNNLDRKFKIKKLIAGDITYFDIGAHLTDKYQLAYQDIDEKLTQFWPKTIEGFLDYGGVFYASSGNRIFKGAKISINHELFFLFHQNHKNWFLAKTSNYAIRTEVFDGSNLEPNMTGNYQTLSRYNCCIYKVKITKITKDTIDLFLKYGIDLVEQVPDFYQFWPPKICNPYQIVNRSSNLFFFLKGHDDTKVQLFPNFSPTGKTKGISHLNTLNGTIYRIKPKGKDQILIIGEHGSIGYAYLNQDTSMFKSLAPKLTIRNAMGAILEQDCFDSLNEISYLLVESEVAGKVKIYEQGLLVDIFRIKSGSDHKLILRKPDLALGRRYDFYHGNNLIRSLEFINQSISSDKTVANFNRAMSDTHEVSTVPLSSTVLHEVDLSLRQRLQLCLLSSLLPQASPTAIKAHLDNKHPIIKLKELILLLNSCPQNLKQNQEALEYKDNFPPAHELVSQNDLPSEQNEQNKPNAQNELTEQHELNAQELPEPTNLEPNDYGSTEPEDEDEGEEDIFDFLLNYFLEEQHNKEDTSMAVNEASDEHPNHDAPLTMPAPKQEAQYKNDTQSKNLEQPKDKLQPKHEAQSQHLEQSEEVVQLRNEAQPLAKLSDNKAYLALCNDLKKVCPPLSEQDFNHNEQLIKKHLLGKKRLLQKSKLRYGSPLTNRQELEQKRLVAFAINKLDGYPLTIAWLEEHAKHGSLNHKVMRELRAFLC